MQLTTRRGFTLVELLVVIAIIGVLVALLVPAIQAAREAARRVHCKNNLRQLALAAITHEEQIGHYPTGGWSKRWVGDADRGFGKDQPGGWAFNVLPFLEGEALRDLAGDGRPGVITDEQRLGAGKLAASPIAIINCPSRRSAGLHPLPMHSNGRERNASLPDLAGKLDYAINGGDVFSPGAISYVDVLEESDTHQWAYDTLGNFVLDLDPFQRSSLTNETGLSGVSFVRSEVGARHVTDGISNTYLIGEKSVQSASYDSVNGDNFSWIHGYHQATCRFGSLAWLPVRDQHLDLGFTGVDNFGSAHAVGLHMAYCDGSVRVVEYGIDAFVDMAGANRKDGSVHGRNPAYIRRPRSPQ